MPPFIFLLVKNAAKKCYPTFNLKLSGPSLVAFKTAAVQAGFQGSSPAHAAHPWAKPNLLLQEWGLLQVPLLGHPTVTFRSCHSKMEQLPLLAYLSCLEIPLCWVHNPSAAFISTHHTVSEVLSMHRFWYQQEGRHLLLSCHHLGWEKRLIYLNFVQQRYFQSSIVKGELQLYIQPGLTR